MIAKILNLTIFSRNLRSYYFYHFSLTKNNYISKTIFKQFFLRYHYLRVLVYILVHTNAYVYIDISGIIKNI